jgi:hypothetical protein
MNTRGVFNNIVSAAPQSTTPANVPVATRVVVPKPQVSNSAAASAAASVLGNKKQAVSVTSLHGSDEEFMKQWQNRL